MKEEKTRETKGTKMLVNELLREVFQRLQPLWPDAKPLLHYRNCFELLVAVILSAQTNDDQVNAVTPLLFEKFPDAASMACAHTHEVEEIIRSIGFYHVKARHIIQTATLLIEKFGGSVPDSFEDLLSLPGVGRKTANLVISACHDKPGIIVDTHVMRVLYRLGIGTKKDPAVLERIVRNNLDESFHTQFSHCVNRHGKFVCTSRSPACISRRVACPLEDICAKRFSS